MSKVYSLAKIAKPVGTGVSKSYWLELFAVGKRTNHCRYFVANELIGARLGSFLGLPIPPFALLQMKGETEVWFSSVDYRLTGHSLPPIDPTDCVKEFPSLSTGIILFDLWIANTDRHTGNLNMDISPSKSPRLNVFDHGHALFSFDGESRLNNLLNEFAITEKTESGANRHCLLDELNTSDWFDDWYERIEALPKFVISDTCESLIEDGILSDKEAGLATSFLVKRQQNLRDLVRKNQGEFQSIISWPLI